jgi:hypothetical protein
MLNRNMKKIIGFTLVFVFVSLSLASLTEASTKISCRPTTKTHYILLKNTSREFVEKTSCSQSMLSLHRGGIINTMFR